MGIGHNEAKRNSSRNCRARQTAWTLGDKPRHGKTWQGSQLVEVRAGVSAIGRPGKVRKRSMGRDDHVTLKASTDSDGVSQTAASKSSCK